MEIEQRLQLINEIASLSMNEYNSKFTEEAIAEWNMGYAGNFEDFKKVYKFRKWLEMLIGN